MLRSNRNLESGELYFNRRYPFQVAFAGACSRLMEAACNYCSAHLMPFHSRWDMRGQLRYCFAAAAFADELADAFGGERIDFAVSSRSPPEVSVAPTGQQNG
jgi:hypothetical protein